MAQKILIVGGVAGGATAAGRIRRLDSQAEIIIFEREEHISFANCAMPYYIGDVVKDAEEILFYTPESFGERYDFQVRDRSVVTAIDTKAQQVTVENLRTGEVYTESYDKLLLSPGAKPRPVDFPGTDLEGVFRLRKFGEALEIKEFIKEKSPKRAIVVGGGFIGLEMVEAFRYAGLDVTLLQRSEHIFRPLDPDMVSPLHTMLREEGVHLKTNTNINGIEKEGDHLVVTTDEGDRMETDVVLLSLGVVPESEIAVEAGIQVGARGGIVTNNRMETSAPNVYAIGDAIEVTHAVSGQPTMIPLAGPAQQQARVVADNICGGNSRYRGSQGSSVLKIFDVNIATTGLNSAEAERAGFHFDSAIVNSVSRAGYYPDHEEFSMKVVYEKFTGRILGAQVVGGEGVDKRADTLAVAIQGGMNAWDLEEMQLCYAPPFGIPRDAQNIVGSIITGKIEKQIETAGCVDLKGMPDDESAVILDVRPADVFDQGHVPRAKNLPYHQLNQQKEKLDISKKYYMFCGDGKLSYLATQILREAGFQAYNVCGGWDVYRHLNGDK